MSFAGDTVFCVCRNLQAAGRGCVEVSKQCPRHVGVSKEATGSRHRHQKEGPLLRLVGFFKQGRGPCALFGVLCGLVEVFKPLHGCVEIFKQRARRGFRILGASPVATGRHFGEQLSAQAASEVPRPRVCRDRQAADRARRDVEARHAARRVEQGRRRHVGQER